MAKVMLCLPLPEARIFTPRMPAVCRGARDKWDKDIANFNDDLKNVEECFSKSA